MQSDPIVPELDCIVLLGPTATLFSCLVGHNLSTLRCAFYIVCAFYLLLSLRAGYEFLSNLRARIVSLAEVLYYASDDA
jgi:predicted membrane channel-forming protein YqfA (hemolysin III family)